MAAINKDELLTITQKDYDKLFKLLEKIDDTSALNKGDDDTSIKDTIGHRAHWIDLFLGWYGDGQAGQDVHFPAKGYKWNQLREYNAMLREKQADLSWKDVKQMLHDNHTKLLELINTLTNEELYGGPMKGANNNWTTGRWAEASGPSHYRSAAKYIRQCLKKMA